jgi:hypothetical protein
MVVVVVFVVPVPHTRLVCAAMAASRPVCNDRLPLILMIVYDIDQSLQVELIPLK